MGDKELQALSAVFALAIKQVSGDNNINAMKQTLASLLNLENQTMTYLQGKIEEDSKAEKAKPQKRDGKNNK